MSGGWNAAYSSGVRKNKKMCVPRHAAKPNVVTRQATGKNLLTAIVFKSRNSFKKLILMTSTQAKSNKKQWTSDEDALLMELVKEHGVCGSWPAIALHMDWRSGKQCRERYVNQLDPMIKKSMWTHEEDATIKKMHFQVGKKWSKFMEVLPGRSDNAIKNRYHIISRNNYSEHNKSSDSNDGENSGSVTVTNDRVKKVFVPETAAIRLDRFRSARDILDRKINALLLEQDMLLLASVDDETLMASFNRTMQEESPEELATAVLDSLEFTELDFAFGSCPVDSKSSPKNHQGDQVERPAAVQVVSGEGETWSPDSLPSSYTSHSDSDCAASSHPASIEEEVAEEERAAQERIACALKEDGASFEEFNFDYDDLCYQYDYGNYLGVPLTKMSSFESSAVSSALTAATECASVLPAVVATV